MTAFAHHGSPLDAATGLQHKGERWYSPDLGRFHSEDPIQDGSNWYMFAGNDPMNYADFSGLSQQRHPLNVGYSGNRTTAPVIKSGFLPGFNPVDTATAIYRGVKALSPYVTGALASPTAARLGNAANLVTTFDTRNSILPAGDPNLPRLFSIATATNHSVRGGSRGDLFEALQFAQASAYQDARRFNIVEQFRNEGRVYHPNLGPPTASIDHEADVLNREFNSRGLRRVALERLTSNGMHFQGTASISGIYQLKSGVQYQTVRNQRFGGSTVNAATTTYSLDKLGRLASIADGVAATNVSPTLQPLADIDGKTIAFQYDDADRLKKIERKALAGNAFQFDTSYDYD